MSYLRPLKIKVPLSFYSSQITAIRVQDVARDVWYSWDRSGGYPNGYWDNAGGGGKNAPIGETPMITPGQNNLYIAFYAQNNYNMSVNMTLIIYDGNYNALAQVVNLLTAAGAGQSIQYTGPMIAGEYTLILYSEP